MQQQLAGKNSIGIVGSGIGISGIGIGGMGIGGSSMMGMVGGTISGIGSDMSAGM